MYIEQNERDRREPVPYLLVAPTPDEERILTNSKRDGHIGGLLILAGIVWLVVTGAMMISLFSGSDGSLYALAGVLFIALMIVPTIVLASLGFHINGKMPSLLYKMQKEDRAFELRWYGLLGFGDVGNTLMRRVLFADDRAISLEHMREVILGLDPSLLDQFLVRPVNIDMLRRLSNAETDGERDAWVARLRLGLQVIFTATQPDVDHYLRVEAEEHKIRKINLAKQEARGIKRVLQYDASTGTT